VGSSVATTTDRMSQPDISVALLVRNGMPTLRDSLASLVGQTGCAPFEIVALDSGSTDGSLDAMASARARIDHLDPAQFRFGPARQQVFGMTRGRVIVTLSQDAVPGGPTWLSAMTEPILSGDCDLVQSDELDSEDARRLVSYSSIGTAYAHWPMPWIAISCSGLAISRSAWAATGFGTVPMSEDKYLAVAARRLGFRVEINRSVPLLHGHVYTATSLMKRGFNEGMGARFSEGRYSLKQLVRDLTRPGIYRRAFSEVVKQRKVSPREAAMMPLRPLFLYLGYKFGKGYWR
jgi:rhamnosyltransferase